MKRLEDLKANIINIKKEITEENWNEFVNWLICEMDFDCDSCVNKNSYETDIMDIEVKMDNLKDQLNSAIIRFLSAETERNILISIIESREGIA